MRPTGLNIFLLILLYQRYAKKYFRPAVRILKLTKKFQNPVDGTRGGLFAPRTPPAALSHKVSARFFDSRTGLGSFFCKDQSALMRYMATSSISRLVPITTSSPLVFTKCMALAQPVFLSR